MVVAAGDTVTVPEVPLTAKFEDEQELAFVEEYVNVEDPPELICVGLAVRVTVGFAEVGLGLGLGVGVGLGVGEGPEPPRPDRVKC